MPEPTGAPAPDRRETSPPTGESDAPASGAASSRPSPAASPRLASPPAADASPRGGSPGREVHCADALAWLAGRSPLAAASFVTSLPDVCEVPLAFPAWRAWFIDAAAAVLQATPPEGVAIFYQTDSISLRSVKTGT